MKHRVRIISMLALCAYVCFMLGGCTINSSDDVKLEAGESLVSIEKDDSITSKVVEAFDKDTYKIEDLKKAVESEISEFNQNYASDMSSVTVKTVEKKGDNAIVELHFLNSSDFNSYEANYEEPDGRVSFFAGSCEKAIEQDYVINGTLTKIKDDDSVDCEDVIHEDGLNVVVTNKKCKMFIDGEVVYIGKGVTYDKGLLTISGDSVSYIFYK